MKRKYASHPHRDLRTHSWRTRRLSLVGKISILLAAPMLSLGLFVNTASANVKAFQTLVAADANLTDQYTFDGGTLALSLLDKKGTAHLTPFASQGWNPPAGTNIVTGLNPASQAAYITNSGATGYGGTDGHSLIGRIYFGANFSYEIVFRCDQHPTTTGSNSTAGITYMGWLLSTRSDDDARRGYLLWQGQIGATAGDGTGLGSVCGNSAGNILNGNRVANSLIAGHWYYVAGAYTTDMSAGGGLGVTSWTNYIADLTAGDTTLTAVAHTNPAGSLAPHDESVRFGIGGRYDGWQNVNPCAIDEVNIYSTAALDQATFQAHYNALRTPQNFIVNPGFEDGTGNSAPPWSLWGGTGGAGPNPLVDTNNPTPRVWSNFDSYANVASQNNMSPIWVVPGLTYNYRMQANTPSSVVPAGYHPCGGITMRTMSSGDWAVLSSLNGTIPVTNQWYTLQGNAVCTLSSIAQVNYGIFLLRCRSNDAPYTIYEQGGYMDNIIFGCEDYRNDLNGLVKDPFGAPVAGATVTLSSTFAGTIATNITGTDGRYMFTNWAPFTTVYSVDASLGVWTSDGPKSQTVGSGNGAFPDITLTAPSFRISGTVSNLPPGRTAQVRATGSSGSVTVTTALDGTYSILAANDTYTVEVVNMFPLSAPAQTGITVSGADVTGINFTLAAVVPLVEVNAASTTVGASVTELTNSGSLGGVFIPGGPGSGGTAPLCTVVKGYQTLFFDGTEGMGLVTAADHNVAIDAPATLVGAYGGPNPIFTLVVWAYRADLYRGWGDIGLFSWAPFYYGANFQYGDGWAADHYGSGNLGWGSMPPAGTWHQIVYTSDGVTERVYSDGAVAGTATAPTAFLNVDNYSTMNPEALWNGVANPFALGQIENNNASSWFDTRNFRGAIAAVQVYDVAVTPADVAALHTYYLPPNGTSRLISGHIYAPGGSVGIDGATVTVSLGGIVVGTATTAGGGVYSIAVGPGTYTVAATAPDYVGASLTGVAVVGADVPGQDITLGSKYTVSGHVYAPGGSTGIDGAAVTIRSGTTVVLTTNTSGGGAFAVRLAPGTYSIAASAANYLNASLTGVAVVNADVPNQNLTLVAIPPDRLAVSIDMTEAAAAGVTNRGYYGGNFIPAQGNPTVGLAGPAGDQRMAVSFAYQRWQLQKDGVDVPASSEVCGHQPWTVVAWVYQNSANVNQNTGQRNMYFTWSPLGAPGAAGVGLGWREWGGAYPGFDSANTPVVCWDGYNSDFATALGTGLMPWDAWLQIVTLYDGTTLHFYKNGVEVVGGSGSSVMPRTYNLQTTAGNPFSLGGFSNGWGDGQYWGSIARLKMYSKALTQTEINADLAHPGGYPSLPESGVSIVAGVPTFTFPTSTSFQYRIVYKNAVTDTSWSLIGAGDWTPGTGSPVTLTDSSVPLPAGRFYRLEVQ